MHGNSLEALRRFGLPYFRSGTTVLEIGPDPSGATRRLLEFVGLRVHYHTADIKNAGAASPGCIFTSQIGCGSSGADITNAGAASPGFIRMTGEYAIDCRADAFDLVFSANVIEHVRKPWRWLAELKRVVRPLGVIICVNPVSWPYHEAPIDCWRLLPEAYKALFEEVGLEHVFSWHGNLLPIDPGWRQEHGPQTVTDTIAIGRKPAPGG